MARYTPLSTLLNRMDRWTTIGTIEAQYKVRDIDEAIRTYRRKMLLPWTIKKSTLRVFADVLEYPVASDHDELAYLDNGKPQFSERGRFIYTSLKDFYEDPTNRNTIAEIWDQGTKFLGVRYKDSKMASVALSNAETAADYTASGDASAVTLDNVVFKEGNGSIRFTVTQALSSATITYSFTSLSDSNYKKKYHFLWVYLDSAPTSITLRFGNDSGNYLSSTVTTQFSGQAFKADDWNLVAMDLNTATVTGTIDSTAFDYGALILTGAASGTYYIDASSLKTWALLDYWYYSHFHIRLNGSSVPDQQFFYNSSEVYSSDSDIVGDDEWTDLIVYEALLSGYIDKENDKIKKDIENKRDDALADLYNNYPSLKPLITTNSYRFDSDYFPNLQE